MHIDSHQHFWIYEQEQYDWMDEQHETIRKDFLPSDLMPLLQELKFDGCIAVQARQSLRETQWLLGLAREYSLIKGVVGWLDLCSGHIEKQLNEFAADSVLKGVRHVVHDEPDDFFMLRQDFKHGISLLQSYGLTYDLLLFPKHLKPALDLVREFPEQRFVVDHIAKPDIANRRIQPWKDDLYRLAEHKNVYCKLSGMVTETHLNQWQEIDFAPYLDIVFDAFGPERLMIGSDWPVCLLSGGYSSVMQIVICYISKFPLFVQEQILGGNCRTFYNVK
jgi:L-fuconolactonase